ncbi:armadillo-type protein [Yarrowia lipolytica]|uniref:Serine/threonine-protein kinase TOR n=2 Tax=Yarrowia lipolytica TaxID=4952 RepID=Q6C2K6_YARLI|nr:YALI0F07084p [Yarrowia lipolytica CLIB122]AOW06792.1 hypothetical protein YALI1_F10385g [Yarrowia lipolytica]KAB8284135.1 armadillo-type protein [Yarrowia lipolytica]KAE8168921.1 armadillo-type protein [Yarrowia lipolytica]KAJ8056007.1 armadillo-type protein [Yarrowia lipolytica]RDW28575.1 armadillo-type protein [Yarrowia lipolytica]|eukprot:XP_505106.1 YALI0F07084p [Yarrowia lipolytica CLIB122]
MSDASVLNSIFQQLRTARTLTEKTHAAEELRDHLTSVTHELNTEPLSRYNNDINLRISELIHNGDPVIRLGGIMAIDRLIDVDVGEENAIKVTRFTNYLKTTIPGDTESMRIAVDALGRLAATGGNLSATVVESEVNRALEWLQSDRGEGSRRHAAVMVIKSMAQHCATLLYGYMSQILDLIWVGLRDPKVQIRVDSAEALQYCLNIVHSRDQTLKKQWFNRIMEEAKVSLNMGGVDTIHGALLTYKEVLRGGMFENSRYDEVCEVVLANRDSRDVLIRKTVLNIIPDLAQYNPWQFTKRYLHKCMLYLLSQLKKDKDRNLVFLSIGQISFSVRSAMAPYLDAILENIREGLSLKSRYRKEQESAIFSCIGMLAVAVGQALAKHLNQKILDLIMACGLSEHLHNCLSELVHNIPPLGPSIQQRLLNIISFTLSGHPFKLPGSPAATSSAEYMSVTRAREYRETEDDKDDAAVVALALHILGTFNFKGLSLTEFVRFCAITYVDHDSPEVRKAAALSSCTIYLNDPIVFQFSAHALSAVSEVVEKLLTVAVVDPDPDIRIGILTTFDPRIDPHLSQAENVRLLFTALNDEVFAIRQLSIGIIGRLTKINPAYVVPHLRKTLIHLLTELEYAKFGRTKEESARLLAQLIGSTHGLIKPYVKPIIKVLLARARDTSSNVASAVITAIGELAATGREGMIEYIPEIMPIFLETFSDQNAQKKLAGLKSLGQLSSSSGYVIQPLLDYPQLLTLLTNTLKSDNVDTRRETVRLMGILGALDPYKHREVERSTQDDSAEYDSIPTDVALLIQGMSPSSDEYNHTVVITTLMAILKDQSLVSHHNAVVQAIVIIFKSLGLKCVPFLNQIIPGWLQVLRSSTPSMAEFFVQQLALLVLIVKQHIRSYLDDIFAVVQELFAIPSMQPVVLTLVENIARSLSGEFKLHVPTLLPLLLGVLENDKSTTKLTSIKVLQTFVVLGANIEDYIHLIIPIIVRMFEYSTHQLKKRAIQTIGQLSRTVDLTDMSSRIVHPLLRVLAACPVTEEPNSHHDELRRTVMETLSSLCFQLGSDYTIFIPLVNKAMLKAGVNSPSYDQLVNRLLSGEPLPASMDPDSRIQELNNTPPDTTSLNKLPVNQQHLKTAWDTAQCSTKEDWQEWMRRLSTAFLRESSSHALRACGVIANNYQPLAKDLFNPSFYSCWSELYDQYKDDLVNHIETALMAPNMPPETLQILLNLAEYMEHDDKPLPIDMRTLAAYAHRCHAYAKALHYKELEFMREPTTPIIENLIAINNSLQQSDAAIGILKHVQQHHQWQLKESWYEKLQRWDDALEAYDKLDDNSMEVTMGKMRCLHALGEWESLAEIAQEKWTSSGPEVRRVVAPLAAAASWGLSQWERMDTYISVMKVDSADKSFFNAVVSIHRNNFDEAHTHITRARDLLATELTALISESYNRAYGVVVRFQMLAELEEIIVYKGLGRNSEEQAAMRATWMKRLKGCQRNVEDWQRMLKVRSLVVKPKQDMEMWIKFANLCRKSGRLSLAEKSLNALLDPDDPDSQTSRAPPPVVYAQLKYMWATGNWEDALNHLVDFTNRMSLDLGLDPEDLITQKLPSEGAAVPKKIQDYTRLLARCFLKQGEWQISLQDDWKEKNPDSILGSFLLATHFDAKWYKAWHNWALANFQVVSLRYSEKEELALEDVSQYVVPAIKGFFHSISLSNGSSLQDTLRLLTLWFRYGHVSDASQALYDGFQMLSIDTWLDVIPQLISQIHQRSQVVSKALQGLLIELGKNHPQALLYLLNVAVKSDSLSRQQAAMNVIDKMRTHNPILVEQAELVSKELIRVAVLWHEQWHEGLEDASRFFFGERNIEKMFQTLEPLHAMLERGPETLREVSFQTAFGRDLHDANEWVWSFKRTNDPAHLNQAWDIYYNVFRRIAKQLPQLISLDLQYVSPKLLAAENLELAVPGSYAPGKEIVRIMKFDPIFTVISSKQRPRRLSCKGSDGKDYVYALKGHEDIRQDNLVMQLFGLVNTLLSQDSECFKRHLNITKYPAIPLSPKSGLLGWVPHSDTLHTLIKEYRDGRILINVEHRFMLQMAPDYDPLTHLQKIEVFTYALDNTKGQDLYRVLWLKSRSSEAWLERRSQYTRSLATMSMVGYILGLGDRHPSNLMLDRYTGKVIHIDFGDCFEAAILREKYPETVPFRLTRMLTYAMEVSGIEGSYRITSEHVMRVIRDNKESLLAILEAFAYDPLINWGFELPRGEDLPVKRFDEDEKVNVRMARAHLVLKRIQDKLSGNDIKNRKNVDVPAQVDYLIQQATSIENLCQHFIGWCSFW